MPPSEQGREPEVRGSDASGLGEAPLWSPTSAARMLEFEFTLKYRLDDPEVLVDLVMQRLERSNCSEALVGASVVGHIELQFVRRAATAREALSSATEAVRLAFPTATLVEVLAAPDTPQAV